MVDEAKPMGFFRIWSIEHDAWWKPNENGYTKMLPEAGTYSLADATRICWFANGGSSKPMEAMVPIYARVDEGAAQ